MLDKELMVDKREVGADDSNRINSKESDDEVEQEKTPADKDGKKKGDEDSDEEFQLESNISKALSDKITKVVVVLVLIMLFLIPILDNSQFLDHQFYHSNSITLITKLYNEEGSWSAY